MDSPSSDVRSRDRGSDEFRTTRRAVLAAGGTVALTGLAGCAALDGLLDRAGEQVIGTTASAPAAFYPGRLPSDSSASLAGAQTSSDGAQFLSTASTTDSHAESDGRQVFRTGPGDVQQVPATARAEGREIELEGWAISAATKSQDCGYNSSRSNHPSTDWWPGPDDDYDDYDDILVAIHDIELQFLHHVVIAQDAVDRRAPEEAKQALDAFIDMTENALRPELNKCGTGVCETVRENSDSRVQGVQAARGAIDDGDWDAAARELADVDEIVLGDIERLDDELVERHPDRPRFIDIIRYMRDEPTIGERFTVCLPDAKLPGDRGSVAEQLTPQRIHTNGLIDEVREDDKVESGSGQGDDGCADSDGPVALHPDISCGNVLSADVGTYGTENRGIVGYSTEGGAVVSGAPASADTDGKCVLVAAGTDVTGEIILGEDRDMVMRESPDGDASVSPALVCAVTVTPEDCPCPLPGLFYVRQIRHDDQVILAGGWTLDDGALYDDSVTLLFDEGPTEVAGVTAADVESGNLDDRIVEQFSRDRSRHGSAVARAQVQGTDMNKAELIEEMASQAFQTDEGRKGLNAVNVKVVGERGDEDPIHAGVTALDAPLVHLAGARELSTDEKRRHISGLDSETEVIE